MQTYYRDKYVRFEYGREIGNSRLERLCVGPQAWITLDEYEDADDDNSLFVNTASGNDSTGDGTSSAPYATITKAWNSVSGDNTNIVVLNSVDYAEDLSSCDNDLITGLYAATGSTVRFTTRTLGFTPSDSNSIFVAKTGLDSNAGTQSAPKLTIEAADAIASAKNVVVNDSNEYSIYTRSMIADGWYSNIGHNPTIKFQPSPDTSAGVVGTSATASLTYTSMALQAVVIGDYIIIPYTNTNSSFKVYSKSATVIDTITVPGSVNIYGVAKISDSMFALAGFDTYNYYLYICNVSSVVSTTTIAPYSPSYSVMCITKVMSNGNIVVLIGKSDGYYIYVFDSSGTAISNHKVFSDAAVNAYCGVDISPNDKIGIVYSDSSTSNHGKYTIYDLNFNKLVDAATFSTDSCVYSKIIIFFEDGGYAIFWTTSTSFKYCVYNSSNTLIKTSTTIESYLCHLLTGGTRLLENDTVLITYRTTDSGMSNYGRYAVIDSIGNYVISPTTFKAGVSYYGLIASFEDENHYIITTTAPTTTTLSITPLVPYYYSGIKAETSTRTLNGFIIDSDEDIYCNKAISATSKLILKFIEIKNTNILYAPASAFAVYSTSEIDSQNCLIHDCGCGDYTEENTGTFKYNGYYGITDGYALHIKGTAASGGDITVEHNTFFDNYGGLRLEDNNGTNEVVKNNVFASNDLYDINAETAMTTTYSVITGNTNNVTAGSGCITLNPMFVNEATPDLHLMNELCGDFMNSPALDLADDTSPDQDPGCYNTLIYGPGEQWVSIVLRKSVKFKITREPIGTIKNYSYDGDPYTRITGWIEHVELDFDGVDIGDLGRINAMLDSMTTDTTVRFYPDTVSDYYLYDTYRVIPDKVGQSPTGIYKLSQYGAQGIRLILERKYS